jgi:polyisoprenoid-binding protein YceI
MSTITTEQAVPTGTWTLDTVHSSVGYAVRHSGVSLFKGSVTDFDAVLENGQLRGSANVSSITVNDENLQGHLLSPDFFDAARHPELEFESTEIRREGDEVTVRGDLTLKGTTRPVELRGTIAGPIEDPYGGSRIGLTLGGTVDRTEFGIDWNADLPSGGRMLSDDVELTAELELSREA